MTSFIDFLAKHHLRIQRKNDVGINNIGEINTSVFLKNPTVIVRIGEDTKNCRNLGIYEHCQGIYLFVESKTYILFSLKNKDVIHKEIIKFIAEMLPQMKNLQEFSYQSNVDEQMDMSVFRTAPPGLQKLSFSSPLGIQSEFIKQATHLAFEVFPPDDVSLLHTPELKELKIYEFADYAEEVSEFIAKLQQLPKLLVFSIDDLGIMHYRENITKSWVQKS